MNQSLMPPSIRAKFPVQTGRHQATAENAAWMLRNFPILALTKSERVFLVNLIKTRSAKS